MESMEFCSVMKFSERSGCQRLEAWAHVDDQAEKGGARAEVRLGGPVGGAANCQIWTGLATAKAGSKTKMGSGKIAKSID